MRKFKTYHKLDKKQIFQLKKRLQNREYIGRDNNKYRFPYIRNFVVFDSAEVWEYEDGEIWYHFDIKSECIKNKKMDWHLFCIPENDVEEFLNSHCKLHIDTGSSIILDTVGQTVLENI